MHQQKPPPPKYRDLDRGEVIRRANELKALTRG